jgi:hypothetical protein
MKILSVVCFDILKIYRWLFDFCWIIFIFYFPAAVWEDRDAGD